MTPLGIGIVGTGNIAGDYARDIRTHPQIRLVAPTDADAARAAAGARAPVVVQWRGFDGPLPPAGGSSEGPGER